MEEGISWGSFAGPLRPRGFSNKLKVWLLLRECFNSEVLVLVLVGCETAGECSGLAAGEVGAVEGNVYVVVLVGGLLFWFVVLPMLLGGGDCSTETSFARVPSERMDSGRGIFFREIPGPCPWAVALLSRINNKLEADFEAATVHYLINETLHVLQSIKCLAHAHALYPLNHLTQNKFTFIRNLCRSRVLSQIGA